MTWSPRTMLATRRPLDLALLISLALTLAACGGSGGGAPTSPQNPQNAASCEARSTLDLQPGQTAALTAAQAACFRLAPHAGARYALAGFDARAIEGARVGPEPSFGSDPVYVVGDGSGVAPSPAPSGNRAPSADRAPSDLHVRADAATDPLSPFSRATPWQQGERFNLRGL